MLNRTFFITMLSFALPAVALAADTSGLGFVPLTSIPGIADAGNASTLPSFLNNVYKLAIGVAAVLAVLQIVRAGIMYMGGDSVTEKKDAKNLITLSIGGLILVLSPVIVFSVINPKILNLEIGGLNELASTTQRTETASVCSPACTGGKVCSGGACIAPEVGDGTCSMDCAVGKTCKQGACVAAATGSCSVVADGAVLPTTAQQNCCAAQSGCKVQISLKSALESPVCSCAPTVQSVKITEHLVVTKYVFAHSGSIVPKDQAVYSAYTAACVAAKGEAIKTEGSVHSQRTCTADEMSSGDPASTKCVGVTLACLVKDPLVNTPSSDPAKVGSFIFKVYYKSWYKAGSSASLSECREVKEEANTTLSLCESALASARSAAPTPGAATAKNCIASEAAVPTPTNVWDALKNLPACPTQ